MSFFFWDFQKKKQEFKILFFSSSPLFHQRNINNGLCLSRDVDKTAFWFVMKVPLLFDTDFGTCSPSGSGPLVDSVVRIKKL
jgi:hypothetical protein